MVISDHWRGASDEVVLEGESACGRAGGDAELGEDVLDVPGDGVLADHEHRGDLAVARAGRDQAEHLELARRQPVGVGFSSVQRAGGGEVRRRSELPERDAGRLELEREGLVVAERTTRPPDEQSGTRTLVGRFELLPGLNRLAEAGKRAGRVA